MPGPTDSWKSRLRSKLVPKRRPTHGAHRIDQTNSSRASIPSALRIGGMAKSELLAALREQHVQLNEAAEALFADGRFTTSGDERVAALAAVSVAELGLGEGATYGDRSTSTRRGPGRVSARTGSLSEAEVPRPARQRRREITHTRSSAAWFAIGRVVAARRER